jgi:hypothetical protein
VETEAVLDASAVSVVDAPETAEPDPGIHDAITAPAGAAATRILPATEVLNDPLLAESPPTPPGDKENGGGNGKRNPRKRRLIIAIVSIGLAVLLIGGGIFAAFLWQSPGSSGPAGTGSAGSPGSSDTGTATPIAGPRMIELALDGGALTSIFVTQLNMSQGPLSDIQVIPAPGDSLIIKLNLHIDTNGIHRVMPVEIDGAVGVDTNGNIQLRVYHLKRDGLDAGPSAAASMQTEMNRLILTSVMPGLRGQLKSARLVSVHTSSSVGCGNGAEMLVLLIQAPPIQGIAAQPTPTTLCFKGPIDLNKLLPN